MSKALLRFLSMLCFLSAVFAAENVRAQSLAEIRTRLSMNLESNFVVETPFSAQAVSGQRKDAVTFQRGQIVNLTKDWVGNYYLRTQRRVNGKWEEGRVPVSSTQVRQNFRAVPATGTNLRPSALNLGKGDVIRFANTPSAWGLVGPGGFSDLQSGLFKEPTTTYVKDTRLVNFGTDQKPNWKLSQFVCYFNKSVEQRCGWVDGRQVAQSGRPAAGNSMNGQAAPASRALVGSGCYHGNNVGDLARHSDEILAVLRSELSKPEAIARDEMMDHIGACAYSPHDISVAEARRRYFDPFAKSDTNMYDAGTAKYPSTRDAAAAEYARLSPPKGKLATQVMVRKGGKVVRSMSPLDYMRIDAFARTIYAESRGCATKPGHVEATARVIHNRAMDPNGREFRKGSSSSNTPLIKAVLSDQAFSVWNNNSEVGRGGKDQKAVNTHAENTMLAMCPTFQKNSAELKAWGQAVEVAMFAILDEDAFLRDTSAFAGIKFYTSPAAAYNDPRFTRLPTPKYHGDTLDSKNCMVFFKSNPPKKKK